MSLWLLPFINRPHTNIFAFSVAYLVMGCPSFDQLTVRGASPEALHSMAILVDPGTTFILVGVTVTSGGTVEEL